MKKKVSIIVPNYNGSKYLTKCLESINNQTYTNIEIIIIDDGSTDNSVEIINNFSKNSRFKCIIINQFNQNGSIARNRGIEIATGDYLYFLDSDDELFDNNSILTMVNEIEKNDLLLSNYEIIDEENNMIGDYFVQNFFLNYDNKYKYIRVSPVPSNKLFLTSIVKKYGLYFSNVRIGQDLNFYLKYLSVCENVKVINQKIYKYRIVKNSVTRKINLNFMDIYNSFKEIEKFYVNNNILVDYNFYITGVAVEHFQQQFSKLKSIKERYIRKMLFSYFDFCIRDNAKKCTNKDLYFKNQMKIYYLKKILLKLKIYTFVVRRVKNDI